MNALQNHRFGPHALMIFAVALAAGSFPIGAIIAPELPAAVLMFLRFLLAAVLFFPYLWLQNRLVIPTRRRAFEYLLLSLPSVIFFWCMFESLKYTSAIHTGALYSLVPAITAIYARFINREYLPAMRVIALAIGIVGACIIVFQGSLDAAMQFALNKGDLLFLLGCFFTSLHNPLIKRFHRDEPVSVMTFWLLLFGAIWLALLSLSELPKVQWQDVPNKVWLGVLYMTLFSTLATFLIRQKVVVLIGATRVSIYGLLAPVFVILMSLVLGLDEFQLYMIPGVALIIVSIVAVQKSVKQ